jgi:cytochrome c-type biogenesis protein CcmH/NrfF
MLTASDKNEIESIVKKQIKSIIDASTTKQFEDKVIELVVKDLQRGKSEKEIKEIVVKMFTEFYGMMYQQRSMWQNRIKNA